MNHALGALLFLFLGVVACFFSASIAHKKFRGWCKDSICFSSLAVRAVIFLNYFSATARKLATYL
jgi:hypothetical protein